MAKMRKVSSYWLCKFTGPNTIEVEGEDGKTTLTLIMRFAAGSVN